MAFRSFKNEETDYSFTLPNAISVFRLVGGIMLGRALAKHEIAPSKALAFGVALAASDMEGSLIEATKRWPRFQKLSRILPSSAGRKLDPLADKLMGLGFFSGAYMGGELSSWQAMPVLATEFTTGSITSFQTLLGKDPQVPFVGKLAMVARCGLIASSMAAAASEGEKETTFNRLTNDFAVGAAALGVASAVQLLRAGSDGE